MPRPTEGIEALLGALAAGLVEWSRIRPRMVIWLATLLTGVAAYLAVTQLGIDTDPDLLTSPDLPFRKTNASLAAAFPLLQDQLVVLVDAPDGADARAAAEELADLVRADSESFPEVFLPGDDPFFEDNGLLYLDPDEISELAARIDDSGPLLATLAERPELPILIGALTHAISSEDGLDSLGEDGGHILEQLAITFEAHARGERVPIAWDDLLFEDVRPSHDSMQVLFVSSRASLSELDPALHAIARMRALAARLEPRPGLGVRVTGDMAVQSEEMSMLLGETTVAGVASLLLVSFLLFYALRSYRLLMATVLTLLVGLCWTAGFAALVVGHLNVLTAAFAVLYIGLGADFAIHFALGYLEQKTPQRGLSTALRATGRRSGASLVLCAATTAIGFYAFIPTSYSAVGELGIISGSGVFLSLLATLTLYPALIASGMGGSDKIARTRVRRGAVWLPGFPLRWPRTVLGVTTVVALLSLFLIGSVRFDMDPLNVRDPRVESVQAMTDLLQARDFSAWTIEALLEDLPAADALAARLEVLPEIHEVHTLSTFVPDDQEASLASFARMREALSSPVELDAEETGKGEDLVRDLVWTIDGYGVALDIDAELRMDADDDPLVARAERLRAALDALRTGLPDEDPSGEVALALGLPALQADVFGDLAEVVEDVVESLPDDAVGPADLPPSISERYVTPDGRARLEVFSALDLHQPGALEAFADLVRSVHSDVGGAVVGTVELGRAIMRALSEALFTSVVVITLLMLLLWRSVKLGVITMVPLLIGGLVTAAFTVVADLPFNFANVIVLPLILGMGVDGGIHLVHRHQVGLYGSASLLQTSTARAVLFSALTTIVSFATLGVSHHMGIASLAQLLTAGIAFMLIADVVVLPAILVLFDPRLPTGEPVRKAMVQAQGIAADEGPSGAVRSMR